MPRLNQACNYIIKESFEEKATVVDSPTDKISRRWRSLTRPALKEHTCPPSFVKQLRGREVVIYTYPRVPLEPELLQSSAKGREFYNWLIGEEGISYICSIPQGVEWLEHIPCGLSLFCLPKGLQTWETASDHYIAIEEQHELIPNLGIHCSPEEYIQFLERTWEGQAYLCWLVHYQPFCHLWSADFKSLEDSILGSIFLLLLDRLEEGNPDTEPIEARIVLGYSVPACLIPPFNGPFINLTNRVFILPDPCWSDSDLDIEILPDVASSL